MELKITERGWPAHYICAEYCLFRRNTLIEYADLKWVVSTVGRQLPAKGYDHWETVGHNRYYETMAFEAKQGGIYWDADTSKPIGFDSAWAIHDCNDDSEFRANEMHDKFEVRREKNELSAYYHGVKLATVRCHPDDTYDEEFGLHLLLRRACLKLKDEHTVVETVEELLQKP